MENNFENEMIEVETIMIPLEDGSEVECAIMDDFEVDGQAYMILSPIENDEIQEDSYVYRYREDGEDIILDCIEDDAELEEINRIYDEMMEALEEEDDGEDDGEEE